METIQFNNSSSSSFPALSSYLEEGPDTSTMIELLETRYCATQLKIGEIQNEILNLDSEEPKHDDHHRHQMAIAHDLDQQHLRLVALANSIFTTITLLKLEP